MLVLIPAETEAQCYSLHCSTRELGSHCQHICSTTMLISLESLQHVLQDKKKERQQTSTSVLGETNCTMVHQEINHFPVCSTATTSENNKATDS